MSLDFLLQVFDDHREEEAVIWRDRPFSYGWLRERLDHWRGDLAARGVGPGSVVALETDYSPEAAALFLALTGCGAVLVPLSRGLGPRREEFTALAQAQLLLRLDGDDQLTATDLPHRADHELYRTLEERGSPGLVVFSSGSTGEHKAAVHDLSRLLEKFQVKRHQMRTIPFLLFDHLGGLNTMLYVLSNGGCVVTVEERTPDAVLQAVDRHRVDLLPTSPTFLHLILLSEAWRRHDLKSLRIISYGTEPMPESTLKRCAEVFPGIRLLQTYGLSELGVLRSRSRSNDSLWVKVGGEGFETRVVDGILHIKARSAMLGYLNAESPFTEDGWYVTGDAVEVDGEYVRFLGRKSEIINVGGQKVYPAQVESAIQQLDNVADVTVHGEPNPILGQIVCAQVSLQQEEEGKAFTRRLKQHCQERLHGYQVPVKVRIIDRHEYQERFKKVRRPS